MKDSNPFEPIKQAETPDEMRAVFERLCYHDYTVRHVFDMARYRGMSGEDKYVSLAYILIKKLREFQGVALNMALLDTSHEIVKPSETIQPKP
jgi:hypothetical protein